MAINIASPGEAAGSLREALLARVAPAAPVITATGETRGRCQLLAVPPSSLTFFPSDVSVSSNDCWVQGIDFEEDDEEMGLSAMEFSNLGGIVQDLDIDYCFFMTSLSFPLLKVVGSDFDIGSMDALTSLDLSALEAVGSSFQLSQVPELTSLSLPELVYLPSLDLYGNLGLTEILAPNLLSLDYLYLWDMDSLAELDLSGLTYLNYFSMGSCPSLTSIAFPALERVHEINFGSNAEALTSFSYGDNLVRATGSQYFGSCTLDQESVDHILTTLAGLDGTGGTSSFASQNVDVGGANAIPGAEGLAAVAVLEGRSCTVTYNTAP